jgi:Mg2+-importing ATPase
LTDLPEMAIGTDSVDEDMILRPQRWNVRLIRNFMLVFGPLSSVFDYMTFGALYWFLGSDASQFRTGWFLESVTSAALVVLVVRSRRPLWRSRPSPLLTTATILVLFAAAAIPWTRVGDLLEMAPISAPASAMVAAIVLAYVASAELAKAAFYRFIERSAAGR